MTVTKEKKVKVLNHEHIVCFDVDGTLALWHGKPEEHDVTISFYGEQLSIGEFYEVTRYLKSLKARGYLIVVWSGNGYEHAEQVVRGLELERYVDFVMSKPEKVIDNSNPMEWLKWVDVKHVE
jgi:phosphoglycolate phosphatase-like HAD superfamily hydrolase